MGFLSNNKGLEYRFGFLFKLNGKMHKMKSISLNKSEFRGLLDKNTNDIKFSAIFEENEYNFEIKNIEILSNDKIIAKNLLINGNEGNYNNYKLIN